MSNLHTHFSQQTGKVILAGAGPGDPELITLKAMRHLNNAGVILADRLVNPAIMLLHAPQAEVIYVGKKGGSKNSTPQTEINNLLVTHAKQGRYVVRLKGGDSNIFSNIFDEITALQQARIPFEIIPGISAFQGAAATLQMPLTARNYARGIRLLTYYQPDIFTTADWQHMATTTDTLVFYMSGSTCFDLADKLLAAGKPQDTPIILAAHATCLTEQYHISSLSQCRSEWSAIPIASPALLIVGTTGKIILPEMLEKGIPSHTDKAAFLTGSANEKPLITQPRQLN